MPDRDPTLSEIFELKLSKKLTPRFKLHQCKFILYHRVLETVLPYFGIRCELFNSSRYCAWPRLKLVYEKEKKSAHIITLDCPF